MKIINRKGQEEPLSLDKILKRIRRVCDDERHKNIPKLTNIDPDLVTQKVTSNLYDGISSTEIDEVTAKLAVSMVLEHPEYGELASRIIISNMHKNTAASFSTYTEQMAQNEDMHGDKFAILSKEVMEVVKKNKKVINSEIDHSRDYLINYFGYKTLEKSYLLKTYNATSKTKKLVERPQYLFMRVAIGIHGHDLDKVFETYNLMSQKYFTHATPTLFNAGTYRPQLLSCYLLSTKDSLEGIFKTITDCAKISKWAGGIGVNISDIRGDGALIAGTNGRSDGIVPMLKTYNEVARYINQAGKRLGSFAFYLEPWHCDIMDFLDMKKPHGDELRRARDLFYALWIPDLFMECVKKDKDWYLMTPNECPELTTSYGKAFEDLYHRYVNEGKYVRKVRARKVWDKIMESQIESGVPYIAYKDAANRKTNQKNVGVIKGSNLCIEILEYSSATEYACCTLASLGLPAFVNENGKDGKPEFNFKKLEEITRVVVRNLNKVIDINWYPVPETEYSNKRHRPLGLGVQGLADVYMMMRMPFDSKEAKELNKMIFETIYYSAIYESVEISKVDGPYETYVGSPAQKGMLQFDLWGLQKNDLSGRYDWDAMKDDLKRYGLRNSLLVALMPTASSASILGNIEAFEPITSNIYTRKVLSGEFIMLNKHLVKDLLKLGLWNKEIKDKIILHSGSVQQVEEIPEDVRQLYKTVWEISQKAIIDQAADRGAFVCQTQSMNIFLSNPTVANLTSMHFYGWSKGLKTGSYYIRSKPARKAVQFTLDPSMIKKKRESDKIDKKDKKEIETEFEGEVCTMEEGCITCSS